MNIILQKIVCIAHRIKYIFTYQKNTMIESQGADQIVFHRTTTLQRQLLVATCPRLSFTSRLNIKRHMTVIFHPVRDTQNTHHTDANSCTTF